MKHIKKYRLFENIFYPGDNYWHHYYGDDGSKDYFIYNIRKNTRIFLKKIVTEYISHRENFPQFENIKDIFEGICDYCFVSGLKKPKFENSICSKGIKISDQQNIVYDILKSPYFNNNLFYKTYIINIDFETNRYFKGMGIVFEYKKRLELVKEKLKKFGFFIGIDTYQFHQVSNFDVSIEKIFVFDTNDTVTIEQMYLDYIKTIS